MSMARLILAVAMAALFSGTASAQGSPFARTVQKTGSFEDVRQDVADAITGKGFVIDYTARIGDMLTRTAQDVGARKDVYKSAVAMQFCSAKLSRDTMEADPAAIALCPYVVYVYELAAKPGVVHVGYRRLPTTGSKPLRASILAVRKTLDEIVAKATK